MSSSVAVWRGSGVAVGRGQCGWHGLKVDAIMVDTGQTRSGIGHPNLR
jgi:hypothetical protein